MSHGPAAGHASGKSVMKWEGERKVGSEFGICDILKWKWGSAVSTTLIHLSVQWRRRHTPPSTLNDLSDGMEAGFAIQSNSTISHITDPCVTLCGVLFVFIFNSRSHSLTSSPRSLLYLHRPNDFFPLPSQTAECVRQALDPFQHAVQFMRLLLQELDSFHFHPEHSPHSGLEGRELSWRNAQRNMVKELFSITSIFWKSGFYFILFCCLTFEPRQRFSHLPQSHCSLLHVLQGHNSVCCCWVFLQRHYKLLQITAEANRNAQWKGESWESWERVQFSYSIDQNKVYAVQRQTWKRNGN